MDTEFDLRAGDLSTLPMVLFRTTSKKIVQLDLSVNRLTTLPWQLSDFTRLRTILLRCNEFREIPPVLFKMADLTHLDVSNNRLTSVQDFIACLKNLQVLNLSFNKIGDLPSNFGGSFARMKTLDLSNNELGEIPEDLCEIKTLEVFNIGNNNITKLPGDLAKLANLRVLGIEGNVLMDFPECVCRLANLTELKASNNSFQSIPDHFGKNLSRLEELLLSDNNLKTLPDSICDLVNLTTLDLRNNKLRRLPANFGNLENLGNVEDSTFSVEHNPLEDPPLEICLRGIDVIREYQSGSGFMALRKKVAEKQKLKRSEVTSSTLSLASNASTVCDKEYSMERRPRGVAILIDNLGVYNTVTGNESDSEKLFQVFTKLGFVVRLYTDRTSEEISHIMEVVGMEDHSQFDSMLACFISHGSPDMIFGYDSLPVPFLDLVKPVTARRCPSLAGKPKIFLSHLCLEEQNIDDIIDMTPEVQLLPKSKNWEDFIFCFNIFYQLGSLQRTVYMEKLVSFLGEHPPDKDLKQTLRDVIDSAAEETTSRLVFAPFSTLKKKVILK